MIQTTDAIGSNHSALLNKIDSTQAAIGIIGLGYVGLPLAVGFAGVGFDVTGIELDNRKVEKINRGENYIGDVDSAVLEDLVAKGLLRATDDFSILNQLDVVIICVPTPLRKTGDPDISSIVAARDRIRECLHPQQLIILESTSYPGTVNELILPDLLETGQKVGEDFFLAFSPERVDPSNEKYQVENTPKVVGGVTQVCTDIAVVLYGKLIRNVVPVSSPATAEMVKLLENTFRSINIGLANEIAIMCRILGLDVWEVIDAASTKPFGFMPFYPGPGLGGHCIPVDPSYLSWKLRAMKYRTRFIDLATEINSRMPDYVVGLATEALNERSKSLKGAKALLIGIAYKKDVDDIRESPALDVLELFDEAGVVLSYHDPFVRTLNHSKELESIELTPAVLKEQDIIVILTDHSQIDYHEVCRHASLILDTRNATKHVKNPSAKIVKI